MSHTGNNRETKQRTTDSIRDTDPIFEGCHAVNSNNRVFKKYIDASGKVLDIPETGVFDDDDRMPYSKCMSFAENWIADNNKRYAYVGITGAGQPTKDGVINKNDNQPNDGFCTIAPRWYPINNETDCGGPTVDGHQQGGHDVEAVYLINRGTNPLTGGEIALIVMIIIILLIIIGLLIYLLYHALTKKNKTTSTDSNMNIEMSDMSDSS